MIENKAQRKGGAGCETKRGALDEAAFRKYHKGVAGPKPCSLPTEFAVKRFGKGSCDCAGWMMGVRKPF